MTNVAGPAPRRLAVTFVHGVEISDPHFADRAANLLRQYFEDRGVDPGDALAIRPTSWAEELQDEQDRLYTRSLAFFYTLGSPLALWASRFGSTGKPIAVPAPRLNDHHPGLGGRWVNVVDRDDLVAYPLRPLGEQYRRQVHEDKIMSVGPWWVSWNPLVHVTYWNDHKVMNDVIAPPLFEAWCALNPALAPS